MEGLFEIFYKLTETEKYILVSYFNNEWEDNKNNEKYKRSKRITDFSEIKKISHLTGLKTEEVKKHIKSIREKLDY